MQPQILGISGSPIKNSNTDRLIQAVLERFWSFRHQKNLLKGKLAATILTGLAPEPLAAVNKSLAAEIKETENMDLIGQLTVQGNLPCAFCSKGDECETSGMKKMFESGTRACDVKYARVEDQKEVWDKACQIGQEIAKKIKNQILV